MWAPCSRSTAARAREGRVRRAMRRDPAACQARGLPPPARSARTPVRGRPAGRARSSRSSPRPEPARDERAQASAAVPPEPARPRVGADKRVPSRRLVAGPTQLRIGARTEDRAHELAARGLAECPGSEQLGGTELMAASRSGSAGDSPRRTATTISTASASQRRESTRGSAPSAASSQCASSTSGTKGSASARSAMSQYSP